MDEAHVQHAVGFVEHQNLDPRQVDGPLRHVVEQAAGRGDHDLRALAQPADLVVEADAAVDRGRADRALAAVDANALLDLERELAGRHEHEHADRATDGLAWPRVIRRPPAVSYWSAAGGSAARTRPSCRCPSGRRPGRRDRPARAGSLRAGPASARCSPPGATARRSSGASPSAAKAAEMATGGWLEMEAGAG